METTHRPLWKRIVYWSAVAFIVLLVLELLLGVVFMIKDSTASVEAVHDEPYLYYLYDSTETTNVHGFKTQYTPQKPMGIYRIVLIGGSVARGKEPETSIAAFLERELRQRYNTEYIEVVNAGISGYVLQQEFILIQSIIQKYEPNLIIGLDGYNDLLTYYLNQSLATEVALPPHQYRDFRVIKDNRFRKKPYSRFAYFFKNINRVKEALVRSSDLDNDEWLKQHETNVCGTFCDDYWLLTDDIQDFCRAKGIWYVQFVQPVKFEASTPMDGEAKKVCEAIYGQIDSSAIPRPYAFSLVHALDDDRTLFYDDVHLVPDGNQRIAWAMADSLAPVFYQIFR